MKTLQPDPLLWHCHDPSPAIEAAHRHASKAQTNASIVLCSVANNPESTAAELGEFTKLGHIETQRRLSDLCKKGRVFKSPPRKCSVKNSNMTTWSFAMNNQQSNLEVVNA
jgi:hypothetical protein